MKTLVVPAVWANDEVLLWKVRVFQGVQSFHLEYEGTHEECEWMEEMFQRALDNHDKEGFGSARTAENPRPKSERQYDHSDPWTREGGIDQQ
jgi:hypothetical protein